MLPLLGVAASMLGLSGALPLLPSLPTLFSFFGTGVPLGVVTDGAGDDVCRTLLFIGFGALSAGKSSSCRVSPLSGGFACEDIVLESPLSAAKTLILLFASEELGVASLRGVCSGVVAPVANPGGILGSAGTM